MAVFPTIANGIITQYPYTERDEWVVAESSVPSGFSYTRDQNKGNLLVRRFIVSYPAIQVADKDILFAFFQERRARLGYFDFKDDQGFTWTSARFDQDIFSSNYVAPNMISITLRISTEST